jgi:hypothetical protein
MTYHDVKGVERHLKEFQKTKNQVSLLWSCEYC